MGATLFFLAVFVGLVWPVYPVFATIRPFVLGMPFSLVYVVILLLGAFGVLLGLYLWEGSRGLHDPLDPTARDDPVGDASSPEGGG